MSTRKIDDPSSFARSSSARRTWPWAISVLCAALGVLSNASPALAQPTSEVFQLTTGSVFDSSAAVDGTTYVWRRGSGGIGEIYMWTEGDAEPTVISTDNEEYAPRISDGRVVWESLSGSGNDYDVFLWENGSAAPLFNNSDDERVPDVGGFGMVWRFKTWWLVYDNGQEQIEITAGVSGIDEYPRVQDSFLVWEASVTGNSNGKEIFYWDDGTLVQLTNNSYADSRPETDGSTVVWFAANGPSGSQEIMRWTPGEGTTQLTDNAVYDTQPDVSGDVVVFARDDGNDFEIFFRYLGVDYQVTDNEFNDFEPAIDGDRIVWEGRTSGGVRHIYYAILSGLGGGSPPGACCTGMECSILEQSECDEIAGEFIGPETFCDIDTCPESVQPADGWWTYQHDAQRTGRTDAVVSGRPIQAWRLHIGELEAPSPAIGPDGTIYVEGNSGFIAVRPDGSLRWSSLSQSRNTPAIRSDGHLFVPAVNSLTKIDHTNGSAFCEAGNTTDFATVIDPAGNCIYCISGYCRRVGPDCSEQWTTSGFSVASHPALDHDGGIYVAGPFAIIKIDPLNGDELWSFATSGPAGDPAIGADNSIYCTVEPNMVLALNPDGSAQWTTELADYGVDGSASPAIAADGTLYVVGDIPLSNEHLLIALSPAGVELWRFTEPNSGDPQAPVIDGDGTILFSMRDHQYLVALAPEDGSELWRVGVGGDPLIETNDYASGPLDIPVETDAQHIITIEDEGIVLDLNVQIRVLHERIGDLRIMLTHLGTSVTILDQVCGDYSNFACTMLDDEADWIIEEHCESGFCATYQPSNPLSAFDDMPLAGDWILTIEDLEPGNTGTLEEWFLRIEANLGLDDSARSAPAISEDGTIYLTTAKGFLVALGFGCSEPDPASPPYFYRVVAGEGQIIDGVTIQEIEHIEIGEDGLVSFQARVSPGNATASIRELSDGSFRVITQGMVIDDAEIDAAFLARVDAAGTPYMPANILKLGTAAFVNEVMVLHDPHVPFVLAPVILHGFEVDFFDVRSPARFLLYGRENEQDPLAMLLVNSENNNVETVLAIGAQMNAISRFVDFDDPTHGRLLNAAGDFVITTGDLILNGTEILYAGSLVENESLSAFDLPQVGENGIVHFLADGESGRAVYGLDGRRLGAGDVLAGFEIANIVRYDVNTNDQLACGTTLTDSRPAIFTESNVVVVPDATVIDGNPVDDVNVSSMAQNNSDQIAFIARVGGAWGAYVATPTGVPEVPFMYRKALEVGDAIGKGVIVQGLQELSLSQEGLITASVEVGSTLIVAPLQVFNINRLTHFFINNTGMFTGSVIPNQSDPVEIALIDTSGPSITPLLTVGDTIDGFQISSFVNTTFEQHIVNDSGQLVVLADGPLGRAVLTPAGVVLQTGDVIEGDEIIEILSAEINGPGAVVVRARYENGQNTGYAVYSETTRLIGTGDVVDGNTIQEVKAVAFNDSGQLAVNLSLGNGRKAVYVNDSQVLMESETEIDGQVIGLLANSNRVRLNNAGQVAFHAVPSGDPTDRLYLATPTGKPASPYTYRQVVARGDVLDGVELISIKDFQLTDAGLITIWDDPSGPGATSIFIETSEGSFEAYTSGDQIAGLTITDFKTAPRVDDSGAVYINGVVLDVGTVVFVDGIPIIQSRQVTVEDAYLVETSEGVFDGLFQGEDLGGLEINFNFAQRKAPRWDTDGNVYLYCGTQEAGATLFRNGQALVQKDVPGATAPVLLVDWPSDIRVLEVNDADQVLLYGRHVAGEESGLILVNALAETAQLLFAEGVVHPEWNVESIDHSPLDERHFASGNRTFVVRGEGRVAVLSDENVLAIDGRVVGGKTLTDFHSSQAGGNSSIFFIADFEGGNGLFTAFEQIAATGDVVDGYTIASIKAQSVSNEISAYTAILDDGRTGVFRGDQAVAVEEDTLIDGQPVTSIDPLIVRKGEAEAVGFVATTKLGTSIVVASGPDGDLTYRTAATVGDIIEGREVLSLEDVRLNHDDLVSFRSGDTPEDTTLFRETSPGVFTTIVDGDELAALTIDFALGHPFAPRVDENGQVFLSVPVALVGQLVFVDGQPIAHAMNEGPEDNHLSIAAFERFDYVDPDEQGRFVVYGRQAATDPPSLLAVDPGAGSITPLVSHGQVIEGFSVQTLDPAFVDGFGDDGVVLFRASNGSTKAIATNDRIIAREGDEIDGRILLHVEMPRRNAGGWFYYLGEHAPAGGRSIFVERPDGSDAFVRGVGDTVAGQPILSVLSFALNNQNNLAYVALSVGAGGLFADDQPVAVVNISRIEDQLVTGVGAQVSINENQQIAFIANVRGGPAQLYVATFDSESFDCNDNGIPDCEELQSGKASDCNGNLALDECDIDGGGSSDNNANGVPDECECQADFDGDGSVDAFDLASLLGSWGPCPGCPADIDGNGVVDAFDLAQLLGSWGAC